MCNLCFLKKEALIDEHLKKEYNLKLVSKNMKSKVEVKEIK